MAKSTYKEYNQEQGVLFPMSIDSKIPEDSPVRLVNRIVDELDLTDIDLGYKGGGNSRSSTNDVESFVLLLSKQCLLLSQNSRSVRTKYLLYVVIRESTTKLSHY